MKNTFLWSIENFKSNSQKTSKCAAIFESLSYELTVSEKPTKYDAALNEIISFIKKKPKARSPLRGFLEFWHLRRHHFSRAFKNSNAPTTNKSETYHLKYATSETNNLILIDRTYRSLETFGKAYNYQAVEPTSM